LFIDVNWLQDGGSDHPGRGGSSDEPGSRIAVANAAKSLGRRCGGGLAVELLRLLINFDQFTVSTKPVNRRYRAFHDVSVTLVKSQ